VAAGAAVAAARLAPEIGAFAAREDCAPGAVALMGFSQGCMMALATGLRQVPPFAGLLGYAGALPDAAGLQGWLAARPPVCLVHGESDSVVPVAAGRAAAAALAAAGVDVESHWRPDLDHGLDEAGISAGALFLQRILAGA
jgi:phospholipase/carboxylesterase